MKKLILAITLIVGLAVGSAAFAHPGRTDKDGCHTNRKTGQYHCHGGGKAKAPAKAKTKAPAKPAKAKKIVGGHYDGWIPNEDINEGINEDEE